MDEAHLHALDLVKALGSEHGYHTHPIGMVGDRFGTGMMSVHSAYTLKGLNSLNSMSLPTLTLSRLQTTEKMKERDGRVG